MPATDTTRFAPDSAGYIRPPSVQQQIAEKLRRMPKVDAHGHDLLPAAADPTVAPIVDPAEPQAIGGGSPMQIKANPFQGGGEGVSVPAPARGSVLERLAQQLADGDEPPIPAAYTPATPR